MGQVVILAMGKKLKCWSQNRASFPPSQLSSFSTSVDCVLELDAVQDKAWETLEYQIIKAVIQNCLTETYTSYLLLRPLSKRDIYVPSAIDGLNSCDGKDRGNEVIS